jgi:hypothetical protein
MHGPVRPGCASTGCKGKNDAAYQKHSNTKSANLGSGIPRLLPVPYRKQVFERLINGDLYEI